MAIVTVGPGLRGVDLRDWSMLVGDNQGLPGTLICLLLGAEATRIGVVFGGSHVVGFLMVLGC